VHGDYAERIYASIESTGREFCRTWRIRQENLCVRGDGAEIGDISKSSSFSAHGDYG
jgi:hypothetical protein